MKDYLMILVIVLGLYSGIYGQNFNDSIQTQIFRINKIQDLDKLNLNFCDKFSMEITGLYPIIKTLPLLQEDSTAVKTLLLTNGFTQVDRGTGNWDKGPRFIYLKYMKGHCICETFKKYYYNQKQKDKSFDLRISERIICNTDKFMDD
jgi:hypothetical protein